MNNNAKQKREYNRLLRKISQTGIGSELAVAWTRRDPVPKTVSKTIWKNPSVLGYSPSYNTSGAPKYKVVYNKTKSIEQPAHSMKEAVDIAHRLGAVKYNSPAEAEKALRHMAGKMSRAETSIPLFKNMGGAGGGWKGTQNSRIHKIPLPKK